jgi:hypothetical protein
MKYEKRVENPGTSNVQYVIWDTLEDKALARFSDEEYVDRILELWKEKQLKAETSA